MADDKGFQKLNEAKAARTTTAVVKDKNYVRFDDQNHSYIGDFGDPIEVAPYTEQWRIYYQNSNSVRQSQCQQVVLKKGKDAMEPREIKGLEIAAKLKLVRRGNTCQTTM